MEPVLFYRSYGYIEGRQEGQEILILFFLFITQSLSSGKSVLLSWKTK